MRSNPSRVWLFIALCGALSAGPALSRDAPHPAVAKKALLQIGGLSGIPAPDVRSVADASIGGEDAAAHAFSAKVASGSPAPRPAFFGSDRRINAAALDTVQAFPDSRPFVNATNADASIAVHGLNLVTVFNTSGAEVSAAPGGSLALERNLQIGYAYSNNGGLTWNSAHLPPLPGSTWTGNGFDLTGESSTSIVAVASTSAASG